MNICIGGLLEGIYWESGVLEYYVKNNYDFQLYTTGSGSLIGLFYGIYGTHFFTRLREFLLIKENPIRNILSYGDFFETKYSQVSTIIKIGRKKLSLKNNKGLEKFLTEYFEDRKLNELYQKVYFEVFNLKTGKPEVLSSNTKIKDMILMELCMPPYYESCKFNGGNYIPTSFVSLIPMKIPNESIVVCYEKNNQFNKPNNTLAILAEVSFVRTLKNYQIISENKLKIESEETYEKPFNINTFFSGYKKAKGFEEVGY